MIWIQCHIILFYFSLVLIYFTYSFQEKAKFVNELNRQKEVVKRLSDEIEKLWLVIGNLPEVMV